MYNQNISYKLLESFDEEQLFPELWNNLLAKGSSDVIFMTWQWQKVWWQVFGRGKLLIVVAVANQEPIAIAPLFAEYGMLYFVGSGGSDYLDFIGDINDPGILEGMLLFAIEQVPDFAGCQFYHILSHSKTTDLLSTVAKSQAWRIFDEGEWNCPALELKNFPEQAVAATRKKSLLRHEAYFKRSGELRVEHLKKSGDIEPYLNSFFEQHITRWGQTRFPSLFLDPLQKLFFITLCGVASETEWIRFTRISSSGRSIAFHFGFNYKNSFLWYKPTFDIDLAKHSPGEVLLRQLLLLSIEEHAHTFDFGLGDENFKKRFSTNTITVRTWGLYPPSATKENQQ